MAIIKKCISALLSTVIIAGSLIATPSAASAATAELPVSADQTSELKSNLTRLTNDNVSVVISKNKGRLEATPNGTKVFMQVEEVTCNGKKLMFSVDYCLKYYDTGLNSGRFGVYVCGRGKYFGVVQKYFSNVFKPAFINASWKVQRDSETLEISEQAGLAGKKLERGTDYTFYSQISNKNSCDFIYYGKGTYEGYQISGKWKTNSPVMLTKSNAKVEFSEYDGYWDSSIKNFRKCERVFLIDKNGKKTACLKKGIDYVVDFYDSKSKDSYRARITGIENYDGLLNSEYSSYEEPNFVWGRDNWGFSNTKGYSDFETCRDNGNFELFKQQITQAPKIFSVSDIARTKTAIGTAITYNNEKAKNGIDLKGICNGMSTALLLTKEGIFTDPIHIQGDDNDKTIITKNSFMHGYSWANISNSFPGKEKNISGVQALKIAALENLLNDNNSIIKLTYKVYIDTEDGKYKSGHAVVAYGTEEYPYYSKVTQKHYDRRILICDPNMGDKDCLSDGACLYYNSADYSWIIPYMNNNSQTCYSNSTEDYYPYIDAKTGGINTMVKYKANNNSNSISQTYVINILEDYKNMVTEKYGTVYPKGDANTDGAIDERDIRFLQNIVVKKQGFDESELNPFQKQHADIDGDGSIDSVDVCLVQRMLYSD